MWFVRYGGIGRRVASKANGFIHMSRVSLPSAEVEKKESREAHAL